MMLQQFQLYALDWPIVSEHLSFTVTIAVSGLCNSTYFLFVCPTLYTLLLLYPILSTAIVPFLVLSLSRIIFY